MRGYNKIDEIRFDDFGNLISVKGHVEAVKVIEIRDMNKRFLNHQFKKETVMEIHRAEWKLIDNIIDYCGG